MTELQTKSTALFKLLTWMSPNYPIGAFTYSHGLEMAIEDGHVGSAEDLIQWLDGLLQFGSPRNDVIFLQQAHATRDQGALLMIVDLALAFRASAELELETTAQGKAFAKTTSDVWQTPTLDHVLAQRATITHPVALGIAAADHDIPVALVVQAYLHGFVANISSAAVRLVPLGQTDGQKVIQALAPRIAELGTSLSTADLTDLGGMAIQTEICSMRHETQYTRLFRS